ncbi:hypothetical protein ACNRD9_03375, partial [Ralstonia pseudosolanacearum]|uniref:hypothetical protein n=1 Tax=Ralstonia pseudosolanacearum TaxID=1310165 RepID=UPI003AAF767C
GTFYLLTICQGQPAFNAGQVACRPATSKATHACATPTRISAIAGFPREVDWTTLFSPGTIACRQTVN